MDYAIITSLGKTCETAEKAFKFMDDYGLFLLVIPTNGRLWRFDYRIGDKRKTMAFGAYPAMSLANARQRRDDARKLLVKGVDPSEVKKAQKTATIAETENSFDEVGREWNVRP